MIYFKTIRYKNFLSTGNSFTEIELNKNNTGINNVTIVSQKMDTFTHNLYTSAFNEIAEKTDSEIVHKVGFVMVLKPKNIIKK